MTKTNNPSEIHLPVDISIDDYDRLCNEAMDYMFSFVSQQANISQNYHIKREHTQRVIGYGEVISRNIEMNEDQVKTVQLAALFHDIGRFEQFRKYESFDDSKSVDHAQLALEIIENFHWLDSLPSTAYSAIKQAVFWHNKIEIPKLENEFDMLVLKVIRDADKIDILRICAHETSDINGLNPQFFMGLDNLHKISASVSKTILNGKLPPKDTLNTVSDFKLMLMAYVFDINFKMTLSIINEHQYLKKIFDSLPKTDIVFDIYRKIKIQVENQLL